MPVRRAGCNCGALSLACEGEPARVSMCHCLECQKRTGSVFSVQAWFPRDRVALGAGASSQFTRAGGSGAALVFRFCPACGSTVWWEAASRPGLVAVAVGAFADPDLPAPEHSVWERRRHPWVDVPATAARSP